MAKTREEAYKELLNSSGGYPSRTVVSGVNSFNEEGEGDTKPISREEAYKQLLMQNKPYGSMAKRSESAIGNRELKPGDLGYVAPSAGERAGMAWDAGWGSVKASFGAGLEWIGVQNELSSLEQFGRDLKRKGETQVLNNAQDLSVKEFEMSDLLSERFWTDKAPTVIPSMISLMGPAVASGIAGTVATEMALGALWPAALAEPTLAGEAALGLAGAVGGLVGAVSVSRTLEGVMEAGGAWSEILDKAQAKGMSEEDARKLAGVGAMDVFKSNYSLIGMDAAEFALMFAPIKGLGTGLKSVKLGAKIGKKLGRGEATIPKGFKESIKAAVDNVTKSAEVIQRAKAALPSGVAVTSALLAQGAMESSEELFQAYISSEAINKAEGKPMMEFSEFLKEPHVQEAMVLGAIGGIAMQGLGEVGGGLKKFVQGKKEDALNEQKEKTDRFAEYFDKYTAADNDNDRMAITEQFTVESYGDYLAKGKGQAAKEKLEKTFKEKKIDEGQYEKMKSYFNTMDKNYESIPDGLDFRTKAEVIKKLAKKTAKTMELQNLEESLKEQGVDKQVVKAQSQPIQTEISNLETELDEIINPKDEEGNPIDISQPKPSSVKEFDNLVKNAETERELDAILDQADKANVATMELVDKISTRRNEIRQNTATEETLDNIKGVKKLKNGNRKFKGIPVVTGQDKLTDDSGTQKIEVNLDRLQEQYKRKSWLSPNELADGTKPEPIHADQFGSMDEWVGFNLEKQRQKIKHKKKKGQSLGEYETEMNDLALEETIFEAPIEPREGNPKELYKELESNLKKGSSIKGEVSKRPNTFTGFVFTSEDGQDYTFYDHERRVTPEDLENDATLRYIEPKKDNDTDWNVVERDGELFFEIEEILYPSVIEVIGEGGKKLGHVRYSTDEDFAQRERAKREAMMAAQPKDIDDIGEIKYQKKVDKMYQVTESPDPSVDTYIGERLAELFPGVKVFSNKAEFIAYVNKHIGEGKTIENFDALGAAFKDTVYIDPENAIQTTRLHEFAHLYFDAIQDEAFKERMLALFNNDEEAMIEAIAQAGYDTTKVNLTGTRLERFMRQLRIFWAKVKELFKAVSKKDAALNLSRALLNNEARFSDRDFESYVIKKQGRVRLTEEELANKESSIMDKIREEFPEIKGSFKQFLKSKDRHRVFRQMLTDTDLSEDADKGYRWQTFNEIYKNRHSMSIRKSDGSYSPMGKEEFAKSRYNLKDINLKKESSENQKDINIAYSEYLKDFEDIEQMWSEFNTQEKVNRVLESPNASAILRDRIRTLQGMNDKAADHLQRALSIELYTHEMLSKMTEEQSKPVKTFTINAHEILVNKDEINNLGSSIFISGEYSLVSGAGSRNPIIQMHQKHMETFLIRSQEVQADVIRKSKKIHDKITAFVKKNKLKNPFQPDKEGNSAIYDNYFGELIFKDKADSGNVELDTMLNEYLDFYRTIIETYDHNHDFAKGVFKVPQSIADFPELIQRYKDPDANIVKGYFDALWKTMSVKVTGDLEVGSGNFDEVMVEADFASEPISFLDFKKEVMKPNNTDTAAKKIAAIRKVRKMEKSIVEKAKKVGAKDAAGNFIVKPKDNNKIDLGITFNPSELTSNNIDISMMQHMAGAVQAHHMVELAPALTFYQDLAHKLGQDKVVRWLKLMDDKLLYGKTAKSNLGAYGEAVQWFINLTAIRYLALNPMGAMFNGLAGFSQTFTHFGFAPVLKGMRRIAQGMELTSFDKGLLTSFGIRWMKAHAIVNTSQDTEIAITSKKFKQLGNVAFSPITFIENINHAYTTIGLMSDEEWDAVRMSDFKAKKGKDREAYIKKWGKKPEDVLNDDLISSLIDESRRVHGAYHPFNKRYINSTPEGRMVMQFKNWLPDVLLAHIQKEYTDMNSVVRKGILNTTGQVGMDILKTTFVDGDPKQTLKNLKALPDIDKHNLNKFMREAILMGSIALLISSLGKGSDKERKNLLRIMGDVGFIYDVDNMTFVLESPAPVLGTMSDLLQATREVSKVVVGNGDTYTRDSKYGKKGDNKAMIKVVNLLPAHRIIKDVFYEQ